MIRRSHWLRLTAGGVLAAAATPQAAHAQELTPLRVMLAEGDDATPALYAIKSGLFKKYGLDVQIQRAPSGAAALAAIAGNAVDVGGASMLNFLLAHVKGVPISIVAPLAVYAPESLYAALLVKKDAPYKTARDLNGKTIGSPALHDLNWIATVAWIDQNGGDSSTMKTVELPSSAIEAALDEGRIDCSTVTTPRYVQAVNAGKCPYLGALLRRDREELHVRRVHRAERLGAQERRCRSRDSVARSAMHRATRTRITPRRSPSTRNSPTST